MQASFTQTFNIVTADAMYCGIPIVCSKAVPWIGSYVKREELNSADLAKGLYDIYDESDFKKAKRIEKQIRGMEVYTGKTIMTWINRFG